MFFVCFVPLFVFSKLPIYSMQVEHPNSNVVQYLQEITNTRLQLYINTETPRVTTVDEMITNNIISTNPLDQHNTHITNIRRRSTRVIQTKLKPTDYLNIHGFPKLFMSTLPPKVQNEIYISCCYHDWYAPVYIKIIPEKGRAVFAGADLYKNDFICGK